MYEVEEASRGCGASASVTACGFASGFVGPLFMGIISFSLGRPVSFASDGWAAMSDSTSAVARVDSCVHRPVCAWTHWVGCAWECDGTGSRDRDSAACSNPVDSCGASGVSSRGSAVESMIHSRVRLARQVRSFGAVVYRATDECARQVFDVRRTRCDNSRPVLAAMALWIEGWNQFELSG